MRNVGIALVLSLALMAAGARAAESTPASSDESSLKPWELEITPYAWVPRIDVKTEDPILGQRHFKASIKDVLENLDIAAMGRVSGRWHRWVSVVDVFWSKLKEDNTATVGPLRVDLDTEQQMVLAQALVGYRLFRQAGGFLGNPERGDQREFGFDFLAGLNYTYLENQAEPKLLLPQANFQRHIESSNDWFAPALGLRIHNDFTTRLRFETLASVGGFGAGDAPDISWLITSLLSYRFTDHWLVALGHRAVITQGNAVDVRMQGPMIGIGYRF